MKLTKQYVISLLPKRPLDANKGTFGSVLVIAGSENFPGAAYLCCAAAYRVGAGLVTLATTKEVKIIVSRKLPEVTFLSPSEIFDKLSDYNVCLLGPGLGQKQQARKLIKQLLKKKLPKTVIDGDGLNILSKMDEWWEQHKTEVILTPHPGEMSRLTGLTVEEVQADRIGIAQKYTKKWEQTLLLKGAHTVIASPAGEVVTSPFANPALATAGTGDVLAGIVASLLAQGLTPFDAASVGTYIHGLAGEMVSEKLGNAGVLASDLLPILPKAIKSLV